MAERWADRREAGRALGAAISRLELLDPVVLALPRGGVPVAFEVARAIGAPLDIVLVRKLGAPGNKEFGIGALSEGPLVLLDDALVRQVQPPPGYIEAEVAHELAEMSRRQARYAGSRRVVDVNGRTVVLVDDGVATGGTARAALRVLRGRGAQRLVLAVPVGAPDSLESLGADADAVVCLESPLHMSAVGNHYVDFRPTLDAEVEDLLRQAAASA